MATKQQVLTVSKLRRMLYDNENYIAVIGEDEMNNKEARDFLYNIENQDKEMRFMIENESLLIW